MNNAKIICRAYDENGNALPEWLEARNQGLGSSEIAIAAGLNEYESPLALWAKKTGKTPQAEDNDAMFLGRQMEPVVAKFAEKKIPGIRVLEKVDALYRHPEHSWALATPDYWLFEDASQETGLLECKTTAAHNKDKWTDGVPSYYHIQVMWQLGVIGMPFAYLACLIGGRELEWKRIDFDQTVFEQLLKVAAHFMECVRTNIPPEPGPRDSRLIGSLIAEPIDKTLTMSEEERLLFDEYDLAKERERRAKTDFEVKEAARKTIENKLRLQMGGHTKATCGDRAISQTLVNMPPRTQDGYSYWRVSVR